MRDDAIFATQRQVSLFDADWRAQGEALRACISGASVLVVGGAGTIGAATVKLLLELEPRRLHIVDVDENGLARLARAVVSEAKPRAELFYLAADFGVHPMRAHLEAAGPFDVVLDFAAVKHVRSEKSVAALLHMLAVNIVKQDAFFRMLAEVAPPRRLFAVSTDKAADPANFMGASKRLLEEVTYAAAARQPSVAASTARFANVAFSAGSLLESFGQRMAARHPLAAPEATRRFFISPREAAQICLIGAARCPSGRCIIPRPMPELPPTELADVAARFVEASGQRAVFMRDVAEAEAHLAQGRDGYPVVLTPLDTVGEKDEEVFVGADEETEELGLERLLAVRSPAARPEALAALVDELRARLEGRLPTAGLDEVAASMRGVVANFTRAAGTLSLDNRV